MILIQTKNDIEGFHYWDDAPEQVCFLSDRHRHIFEIYCQFEVSHEDREIEIILMQHEIEKYLYENYRKPCEFGGMSCESIAKEIKQRFNAYEVKVLEDGAGGAIVR